MAVKPHSETSVSKLVEAATSNMITLTALAK